MKRPAAPKAFKYRHGLARCPSLAIATGLMLWLGALTVAHSQVIVLKEDFEKIFPEDIGWTIGDANPDGTDATWERVNSLFGGEGAHGGTWKGYCAGSFYPFDSTEPNPTYQHSMRSFMERTINLTGYAGAELSFWYKIPSMDDYYEGLRVYLEGAAIFARDTSAGAWTVALVNLSQFVGGNRTLRIEFSTDTITLHEGCYLDDIVVTGYVSPPNDQFVNATSIGGSMGSVNSFNNGATKEAGEPDHGGNMGGHSIWYRWTAPSGVSVNFNTSGSDFDTLLAVYVGGSVSSLVSVASNDDIDGAFNHQSRVRFTPLAGSTYWMAVDGYTGETGAIRLNWQQGGMPDLTIFGPTVNPHVDVLTYASNDCEVVEGLIAVGTRKAVRFATEARNIGAADLLMGDAAGNPLFTPGLCHAHNHFNGFAAYRVRDGSGNVLVNGNKVGFCLEDLGKWNPGANPVQVFTCGYQGIQTGWSDTYGDFLPGQWVDITGLPAGNYTLEQEINPDRILEESNYGNNITQVPFTIPTYDNNDFVNATSLGHGTSTVTGNNTAASKEFNEPNHASDVGGKSIWYCWTAGSRAGVVFDTIGSSFDTLLAVYTGNSIATLALVTENDDIAGTANRASRVTLIPTPGTVYWIAVDGYNGAAGGVVLNILPANDDFANCQMLSGFQGSEAGFNFGASSELSEPFHAGQLGGRSVWYCWTAPLTGNVEFNTLGSTFDTLLAVYTGVSLNSLAEVASNDDFSFHRQSRVMFSTIAGTDYRIAVDSYGGATGDINLAWGYQCRLSCATAPSGTFLITVQALPLQSYSIESSDDFSFWFSLGIVDTGLSGSVTYDAGPIATPGHRFYRAALLP